MLYQERSGCAIVTEKQTGLSERMTLLLQEKLLQVITEMERPDAKSLRDCAAVLKELTALARDQQPQEDAETGVILLPQIGEAE